MLVTKLSSKGQVVIPIEVRKGLKEGTNFAVLRKKDMIVLKKIKGYSKRELKEMEELDRIWKDIDSGKATTLSKEDFLKEMKSW